MCHGEAEEHTPSPVHTARWSYNGYNGATSPNSRLKFRHAWNRWQNFYCFFFFLHLSETSTLHRVHRNMRHFTIEIYRRKKMQ